MAYTLTARVAPRRRRRSGGDGWLPLVIYDSEAGGVTDSVYTYWSDYYKHVPRDPANVTPAPWVALSRS
jgi:hypothetical protein